MNVTLWGEFADKVEEGKRNSFSNFVVRRDTKRGCFLTTGNNEFDKADDLFLEIASSEWVETLRSRVRSSDIVGITSVNKYRCCTKCKMKVTATGDGS